ncbi:HEAT repeat domain-containing protein [Streptomyces sp. NPDC001388]|uniref:HEAT repeat domain-containing protein n=1 Tax=Streptomyces sp. NPDC001388 TaxID=3364568 RepID=UPI00369A63F6
MRALVSVDAAAPLSRAADDPSREVRVALAKGPAGVDATPEAPVTTTLGRLTEDADALVRGAAHAVLGSTGSPAPPAARAVAALSEPAWQMRAGAATALSAAPPDVAVATLAEALAKALADPNADVRKAAVLALTRHRRTDDARAALATATADSDADVRAYAAQAL